MIKFDIAVRCDICPEDRYRALTVRLPPCGIDEEPIRDLLFWASKDAWFGLCCDCESLPTCDYARANSTMRDYDGEQLLPETVKIIRDLGNAFNSRMQRLVGYYSDDTEVASLHILRDRAIDRGDIEAAIECSRRMGFLEGLRSQVKSVKCGR